MKSGTILFTLVLAIALLGGQVASAQIMNRNRMANPTPPMQPQEEKPKTSEEIIDEIMMPQIKSILELNEFDTAVMRMILLKHLKKRKELIILELPKERTRELLEIIDKEEDAELKASLSAEVYEGYIKISEQGLNFKKKEEKEKKKKERKKRRKKSQQKEKSNR